MIVWCRARAAAWWRRGGRKAKGGSLRPCTLSLKPREVVVAGETATGMVGGK
jgi:hypothetical protein